MAETALDGYVCEYCDKEFDSEKGALVHERVWCKQNPAATGDPRTRKSSGPVDEPESSAPETPPVEPVSIFDEAPPTEAPKTPWRERIWGGSGAAKPTTPVTTERKPRKRRKSTEGIWEILWTGIGRGLIYTSADIPVGNVMTFQGPVVGPIIDKAIAGTVIDTLVQPLAGMGERFEDVSDVVSLPILIGLMERAPQLAPGLEPLARKAIRRHLVEYAKMAKAQKKADAEYRKALEDLGMEDVGDDPVDGILAQIWAGVPEPQGASNGSAVGADVHP